MNLFCHNGAIAPIIKSLRKESVMQRIVHTNHGPPAEVLTLEAFSDAPSLVSGAALVRVSAAPVHPGDLLVGSAASAQALKAARPNLSVIVTENQGWKDELRDALASKPVYVAFDGVGGTLLPDVASFLARGGTIVSYGSLGGATTDIRSIAPRALTIKGVSLFSWQFEPAAVHDADLAQALQLARNFPSLFPVAERYQASDYLGALEHTYRT